MADPWDWSVSEVVKQLCYTGRLYRDAEIDIRYQPDILSLERHLRERKVDGRALLRRLDDQALRTSFNIIDERQRTSLLSVIEGLRKSSRGYNQFHGQSGERAPEQSAAPVAPAPMLHRTMATTSATALATQTALGTSMAPSARRPHTEGPAPQSTNTGHASQHSTPAVTSKPEGSNAQDEVDVGLSERATRVPITPLNAQTIMKQLEGSKAVTDEFEYLLNHWKDGDAEISLQQLGLGDFEDSSNDEDAEVDQMEEEENDEAAPSQLLIEAGAASEQAKKVTPEELVEIINGYIARYESAWRPKSDEIELWDDFQSADEEERQRTIDETISNIDLYEDRLNTLCGGIMETRFLLKRKVLETCENLDITLDQLNEEKFQLAAYELPERPQKHEHGRTGIQADAHGHSDEIIIVDSDEPDERNSTGANHSADMKNHLDGMQTAEVTRAHMSIGATQAQTSHRPGVPPASESSSTTAVEIIDLGSGSSSPSPGSTRAADDEDDADSIVGASTAAIPIPPGVAQHPTIPLPVANNDASEPTILESIEVDLPLHTPRQPNLLPLTQVPPPPLPTTSRPRLPSRTQPLARTKDRLAVPLPATQPHMQGRRPPPQSITLPHTPRRPRPLPIMHPIPRPPVPTIDRSQIPENASVYTISRWSWAELTSNLDRKRIIMKCLQEAPAPTRESIGARVRVVRRDALIQEIKTCVSTFLDSGYPLATPDPNYTAAGTGAIYFTKLFLSWWLADDYFNSGKAADRVRLVELRGFLQNGVDDPAVFCGWVTFVMDRTFSKEALKNVSRLSQQEVIVISSDDEDARPQASHKKRRVWP
ncbi:hypothetical protein M011DRAFT_465178 [Sporormia fimetaria CBS 119925]|uniref:DUF7607 domain-containing protein n=1 Tax=Sporormia fimetaria CBS 119925 TaxID=1340428 RepID=A0A6A6VIH9_9PLEO|nr:hypothetical protein M011DRAFT_465178 [Sporormia fimetaria CBS 119925]